jgi:hypothetical protein
VPYFLSGIRIGDVRPELRALLDDLLFDVDLIEQSSGASSWVYIYLIFGWPKLLLLTVSLDDFKLLEALSNWDFDKNYADSLDLINSSELSLFNSNSCFWNVLFIFPAAKISRIVCFGLFAELNPYIIL